MLPNGLLVVVDRAVGERLPPERFAALVVGLLREDVVLALGRAWPSPSPGHVYPRSRRRCAVLFARAVAEADPLAADVTLGRALHVLADMACPVHAQAVWHYLRDPFERYVDAHAAELAELPLPPPPERDAPDELVESLAQAARAVRADGRQTPWGRFLRRRQPPLARAEVAGQAEKLIPLAAAHARALVDRFERQRAGA
jgi:hypothetical protein